MVKQEIKERVKMVKEKEARQKDCFFCKETSTTTNIDNHLAHLAYSPLYKLTQRFKRKS